MIVTYEAKQFSRGRTAVMGIATLMIAWFHSNVNLPEGSLLSFFKLTGDIGVDMFMLCSGVGIYFALEKHPRFSSFCLSRLKRVVPVFLLATVPWFYYKEFSWGGGRSLRAVLWHCSTLSFWLEGNLTCWYVASILVIYLLTPAYVKLWKKHPRLNMAVLALLYAANYLLGIRLGLYAHLGLPMYRLAAYLMGLSLGKAIREEKTFRIRLPLAAAAGAVLTWVIWAAINKYIPWSLKFFAYGPLALLLALLVSCIPVGRILGYLGKRSLEIYLLYEKTIEIMCNLRPMWVLFSDTNALFALVAFLISLVGAELLARLAQLLLWLAGLPRKLLDRKAPVQ